ncbi:MAG: efflux RND transporter periplasmic adaptor subunit [Bacillota bacterium]
MTALPIRARHKMGMVMAFILAVILLAAPGCQKQEARKTPPPPLVTVEEVIPKSTLQTIQTTGMVEPWEEARLSFQVAGKILSGPPEEGMEVAEGSVLARLDDSDYRAQLEAAGYQLELAGVEVERARSDLDRYEKIFAQGGISQKNLEDARLGLRAAKAREGQAASLMRQAGLAVEHTGIIAPFTGTVLKKLFREGEMVAAGTPVAVMGRMSPFKVSVTVPAAQLKSWAQGSEAWITPGVISSPAPGPEQKIRSVIHKISPSAEGLSGSFRVELKVDSPVPNLRPGQMVGVSRTVTTEKGLWVPLKSVVSRGEGLKYIFVLSGEETVIQREITPGPVAGDRVQVLSGLEAGEQVVVLAPEDLKHGDRVEVKAVGTH